MNAPYLPTFSDSRPVSQDGYEVVVQFDGHHATSLVGEWTGQGAESRADLQDCVLGRQVSGSRDAL